MIRRTCFTPNANVPLPALDPTAVCELLHTLEWADGHDVADVRVERVFVEKKGGFAFEWSFLRGERRYAVYGRWPAQHAPTGRSRPAPVETSPWGLRNVHFNHPPWNVCVQSPDCDPRLPQLRTSLDATAMTRRLAPYFPEAGLDDRPTEQIDIRLLSYRPGRRATLLYRHPGSGAALVGKTFRDRRGRHLPDLHQTLHRTLENMTAGRLTVPKPVGLLDDPPLVLLACHDAAATSRERSDWTEHVLAGADLLGALHCTSLPALPAFTRGNECDVLTRWQQALAVWKAHRADAAAALRDGILALAEQAPPAPLATVHRDFYEKQFCVDRSVATLFDLDTVAHGETAVDVGNFLAHLYLTSLREDASHSAYTRLAAQWVRRYVQHGHRLPPAPLAFYWAAALFRIGAVHVFRSSTGRFAPALWRLCAAIIGHQVHGDSPVPADAAVDDRLITVETILKEAAA